MDEKYYRNRKIVIVVACVLFLALAGFVIYRAIWNSIYSATLQMTIAPSIATVQVDGTTRKASGKIRVKPGDYSLEISADGFVSKTVEVTAVAGETVSVMDYLEPSEGNENWYAEHEGDAMIQTEVMIKKMQEAYAKLAEENPIMDHLPVSIEYYLNDYSIYVKYNIRYEVDEDSVITIIIDDFSGGNKSLAMDKLRSFEVDISKYQIIYNDRSNER